MSRVYIIQYLRALAALAVVALHASERVHDDLPGGLASVLSLGHSGVDLFFVISGFIMWSICYGKDVDAQDFLLRRIIRIAPPYWVATLVWVFLATAVGYSWISITPAHVAQSLAFFPHYNPTFPERIWPVLVPGWTLNYEMFFYLIFAGCLMVALRLRRVLLVALMGGLVLLGAVAAPQQAWIVTYSSPLLLEFLAGCLIADLWRRRPQHKLRDVSALVLGGVLFVLLAPSVDSTSYWSRTIGYGLPAALFMLGAVGLGAGMARVRWLEALGDGSYAIYLFHLFIVVILSEAWIRLPDMHGSVTAIGFVLLCLSLASGLGVLIYRYMEHPLQQTLNAFFLNKREDRSLANR